ncbi:MAG: hypothetical protein HY288_09845 [Planctomycetia bacterium]|nr:hypothetical protein [Planctomycetia bacterium]
MSKLLVLTRLQLETMESRELLSLTITGLHHEQIKLTDPGNGALVNLSGGTFLGLEDTHFPLGETPPATWPARNTHPEWISSTGEQYPVAVKGTSSGVTISGGTIIGMMDPIAPWHVWKNYSNGGAINIEGTGTETITGAVVKNMEDGIRIRGAVGATFNVHDVYMTQLHDDMIDNTDVHSGTIANSFFRGHTFLSNRGGNNPAAVVTIQNDVVELMLQPHMGDNGITDINTKGGYPFPDGLGNGSMFKWEDSNNSSGTVDVTDSVFLVNRPATSSNGAMAFPAGHYRNVTVVWLGGGAYPVPVPSGVTITTDRTIYDKAVDAFFASHPNFHPDNPLATLTSAVVDALNSALGGTPTPTISVGNVSRLEGQSGTIPFVFTASLSAASSQPVTVAYTTVDGTATVADSDYAATAGTLTFAAGVTAMPISVLVRGDTRFELNETFTVKLTPTSGGLTITQGTGTGVILNDDAVVAGRLLFYAGSSRYDTTGNPQTPLPLGDDNAIASDKSAYRPGSGAATFANLSSYDRGINGIMVDLLGSGSHRSITQANVLNDFTFRVGNNNSPDSWVSGPLPTRVTVRSGAGASGADRIELIWADGAIKQRWLEVIVKSTTDTGLAADDVFFFGNEIGDTGVSNTATVAKVTSLDATAVQIHEASLTANIPITNLYDFNKNGVVDSQDVTIALTHGTTNATGLQLINIGAGGPFAPASAAALVRGGDAGVASALAGTSTPTIPAWIVNRLERLEVNRIDLNGGPVAKYFEHLAHQNTAKSRAILVKADQVADALNLDDTLLDSLSVKLGLPD